MLFHCSHAASTLRASLGHQTLDLKGPNLHSRAKIQPFPSPLRPTRPTEPRKKGGLPSRSRDFSHRLHSRREKERGFPKSLVIEKKHVEWQSAPVPATGLIFQHLVGSGPIATYENWAKKIIRAYLERGKISLFLCFSCGIELILVKFICDSCEIPAFQTGPKQNRDCVTGWQRWSAPIPSLLFLVCEMNYPTLFRLRKCFVYGVQTHCPVQTHQLRSKAPGIRNPSSNSTALMEH
jgi:hypothetical protein